VCVGLQLTIQAGSSLAQSSETVHLKGLSLEELVNVEVTTLSKKAQPLSHTPAAVHVISSEEIARSGYLSLPELLKHVPGLQVAQIDGNQWAITSRGFAGAFSSKLLVLIDGRSVYTPLFSGVFWDVQDILLDDIDHIEIIRGPGGSLWGANAVNGIINIISKASKETIGGLVQAAVGSHDQRVGSLRYGHQVSDKAAFRVFGKYSHNGISSDTSGHETADDLEMGRGGFRYDRSLTEQSTLMMRGDLYSGRVGATYLLPSIDPPYAVRTDDKTAVGGGNVLVRLNRSVSTASEVSLQGYFDFTHREDVRFIEDQTTVNVDFNHRFQALKRAELTWGLGYRGTQSDVEYTQYFSATPPKRFDNLWTAFAQAELPLDSENLILTLGSKIEHNDYTGFEGQPSARILWTLAHTHTLWAAVSLAVRTPSRLDHDGVADWLVYAPFSPLNPGPLPVLVRFEASRDFKSERVVAYEIGHRVTWASNLASDLAVFYNDYNHLVSPIFGAPEFDPLDPTHVVLPVSVGNDLRGVSYGLEWGVDWIMTNAIAVRAGYTYLNLTMFADKGTNTAFALEEEGVSPENQFSLRLSFDDDRRLDGQLALRYVDRLPYQTLASYWTLDTRIGLALTPNVEVALVGQNLMNENHVEFVPRLGTVTSQVSRGVLATLKLRF
jgi:iron complex outermembrane receptor protein